MKTPFRFQFDVFVVSVALAVIALAGIYKYATRSDGSTLYLPSGTLFPVVTQTGMLAPAAGVSIPVLLKVSGQASVPNGAKISLPKCFVSAQAKGNIYTGRVDISVENITCFDKGNHVIVDQRVKGWIVGGDGMAGVLGLVKSSPVKLIVQAFANGIAEAVRAGDGAKIKEYPNNYVMPVVEVGSGQKAQLVLSEGARLSLKAGPSDVLAQPKK